MSIDRRMDKEDVVYIYNGILLSHKKGWNNAICSNVDGVENIVLSEVSQISYDITYMWNLRKKGTKKTLKRQHYEIRNVESPPKFPFTVILVVFQEGIKYTHLLNSWQ